MENIKTKAKNFWEEHKKTITVIGGITAATVGTAVWAYNIYTGGYNRGVAVGFHNALDWLDDTFPEESKARALYEAYAAEHPEDIVWVSPSGKVVKND